MDSRRQQGMLWSQEMQWAGIPVEPVDNALFLHFHLALQGNLIPVHLVNAAAQLCHSALQFRLLLLKACLLAMQPVHLKHSMWSGVNRSQGTPRTLLGRKCSWYTLDLDMSTHHIMNVYYRYNFLALFAWLHYANCHDSGSPHIGQTLAWLIPCLMYFGLAGCMLLLQN